MRASDRSHRQTLLAVLLVLPFAIGACRGDRQASRPSISAPTGSTQPTPSAAPIVTPNIRTPYDGVWASKPLTRADLAAALEGHGLSAARLDEWFSDWDKIDYRIFEIEIANGRWQEFENGEGVPFGTQWAGDLVLADPYTIVAQSDELRCAVTYHLSREADALSVRVADDACVDPDDLPIQVAIYESSPFRLVQVADWIPPPAIQPSSSSTLAPSVSEASTSRARQKPRPIGTVMGAPLGYLEYLPSDYGNQPSPLLVFLHGSGESGTGNVRSLGSLTSTGIPSLIANDDWPDARPFVVLAPQHDNDPPSPPCIEAGEIDSFLRFALKHYDVDPTRVYLTGLSCGAIGLWNYLAAHTDELVAAAVPIAGYGIGAIQLAGCDLGRVPIWAFHGSADENVPVRGDVYAIRTLQSCTDPAPVDARLKVYQDEPHDVWSETYISTRYDIYDWMLSHHK